MARTSSSGPNGWMARLVTILALLTALITVAATTLFLVALLPLPETLRPWVGLGIFLAAGAAISRAILNKIRGGDAAIRQRLDDLLTPLGFSLQRSEEQKGLYAGVYRGHEMQAAYAISGAPQRPTYHLEIAAPVPTRFRMAVGMKRFRFQFDEARFGQPLAASGPDFEEMAIYADEPEMAGMLLAQPEARAALRRLLSPEAPGVRNLILADGALALRYRHLSLKGLSTSLLAGWMDDLITILTAASG